MRNLCLIILLSLTAMNLSADNGDNFKWIKEIRYEQIRPYCDGLSAFKQNDKWGFLDVDGKVAIEPIYEECMDFSNGFAAVKKDGRWGYINAEGTIRIEPSFDECTSFKKELAKAKRNGKWGVIDKKGTSVAGFMFDTISDFYDGYAYAENSNASYYIRTDGKAIKLDKEYRYGNFSEGLAPVMKKKTGKWGFCDSKGRITIDTRYDTVYNYSNGIALVKRKDQWEYINTKGSHKKLPIPEQPLNYINGLAKVKIGSVYRFMNTKFELLPVLAKNSTDFNESGTAVVMLDDGTVQYINTTGNVIARGQYDRVGNFNDGLAWVSKNGKFGYINYKGEIAIDTIFTSATDFHEGVAFVSHNGRLGSIKYQKNAVMPELEISRIDLRDRNANKKVEAEENFTMSVMVSNPSDEDLSDVSIQFANNVNQANWFEFDNHIETIPVLRAHSDTVVNFTGKANVTLVSEDIDVKFRGTASNMFPIKETDWAFEAMGINACKPIITNYWFYKDNHTALAEGDKVNLKLTIKNDGKDLAKNVKIDLQLPEGTYKPDGDLIIPTMKPGEVKEIKTELTLESVSENDLTVVATISDFTQLHNKVEYLSFSAGRMNAEVSLENGGVPMRFQYGNDYQNFASIGGGAAVPQLVAATEDKSQEIGFTSELLTDISQVAQPDYNKYALVIGNEDYNTYKQSTTYEVNVDYAVADAEAFAEYATDYMGVPKENVILLRNATSTQMRFNLNKLVNISKVDPGTRELYVFYAGHGQVDAGDHETYLIPTDVSISDPTYGIKIEDLYATLGESQAKRTMVFMDACYSGQGRGIVMNVKKAPVKGNMVVFTATSSLERSMPYKEKKHGMFTYFLLKTIKESDGKMSISDLYNSVKRTVATNSMWINNQNQTPELINGEGIEEGWQTWTLE
ncbi:MAG: WG repeat-containing protein [Candidatus Cryptobacteroides sp.]